MICEINSNQPVAVEEKLEVVRVPGKRFLRLAGTDDLVDARARRLQAIRRYKAKLKAPVRVDGRLFRFVYRNPEYRRLEKTIDWANVVNDRRSDSLKPIKLSPRFQEWMLMGDKSVLRFAAVCLVCNYTALARIKHEHMRRLLFANKEKEKIANELNAARRKELRQIQRQNPDFISETRLKSAADFQNRKQKIYAYRKHKRRTDPQYRISSNLRTYIYQRVGAKNTTGQSRFREVVGCSIEDFCKWLEQHFEPGMNWGNYGKGAGRWSIDHVKPCALFDLTVETQVWECFNYSNMKPLWWVDNLQKSDWLPNGERARDGKFPLTPSPKRRLLVSVMKHEP